MTPAVFLVILCFGVASGAPARDPNLDAEWKAWKIKYAKSYSPEEELKRAVWEENMKMIELHNMENGLGKNGFTMKMNAFADMTGDEFRKSMNNILIPAAVTDPSAQKQVSNDLPDFKDWRKEGYVTPVRNQGKCGSCWAFAAAGAIEGQMFSKTGNLTPLSVQNLLDCSKTVGNNGCHWGTANKAFEYVFENKGLEAEATYPYEEKEGPCRYNSENASAYITDFVKLPPNEIYLSVAVASIGPISAAVDASHDSFIFYNGGIYHEPNCSSYSVNHAVLIVGYGYEGNVTDGNNYWLIKNSWGEEWGMNGYMKIAKDRNNHCGIASLASFPNIF
ncbi:cathepsin J isoform X2 [Grammomys surdaster]|uniref:cathepsin J isoform X2 n=1 Tax=Grammomys surdaster TaxID=491861 RepID=UPI0010A03730|nr:cathepsin J isoform X2 [Grammomys surdaster]